jgi:hypothetical protein
MIVFASTISPRSIMASASSNSTSTTSIEKLGAASPYVIADINTVSSIVVA